MLAITPKEKLEKYLGIDYGRSKVGLAIADSETRIAFVLGTIENDKHFFERLFKIIQDEEITKIILGLPSHINRVEVVYDCEKIGKIIEDETAIPVEYQDEMFTTVMAKENLIARGVKSVKRHDDEEAARIILQSWLDKKSFLS